jgi:MFS family permease
MGMTQPSISSLVSRRAGAHEQGSVLGLTQSIGSFARIVGPAVAGVLFAELGRDAPFLVGAVIVGIALAMALRLRHVPDAALAGHTP